MSEVPAFKACIVKLTGWCNLDCTYCYVFNQHDRTHTHLPRQLSEGDALVLLARIEEHAKEHQLERFHLVLHGGEPTLWPLSSFRVLVDEIGRVRGRGLDLSVSLQTNGYHLRPELMELLAEGHVELGVSLDGPRVFNDRYRVTHSGKGSYDIVARNVASLLANEHAVPLSGILCVADPDIPPKEFYRWLDELGVHQLDLLWPMEFNYANPPWKGKNFDEYSRRPIYGEWMAEMFRLWWERDDPEFVIRLFSESVLVLAGSPTHTDMLVNETIDSFVVNTDGGVEYHDFLRAARDGGTRSRFNVREHTLSEAARDPLFRYLYELGDHVPSDCEGCEVLQLCGGGYLPGRVDGVSSYPRRRSVLCLDQHRFFREVYEAMAPHLDTPLIGSGPRSFRELPPLFRQLSTATV